MSSHSTLIHIPFTSMHSPARSWYAASLSLCMVCARPACSHAASARATSARVEGRECRPACGRVWGRGAHEEKDVVRLAMLTNAG